MGDRANIVVIDSAYQAETPPIFLYTHWGGSELSDTLAAALKRGKGRWNDGPYLTRIIFNEMTAGDEMGETGFGISTYITDNSYDLLVVDITKQEVRTHSEGSILTDRNEAISIATFEEFVEKN